MKRHGKVKASKNRWGWRAGIKHAEIVVERRVLRKLGSGTRKRKLRD